MSYYKEQLGKLLAHEPALSPKGRALHPVACESIQIAEQAQTCEKPGLLHRLQAYKLKMSQEQQSEQDSKMHRPICF